MLLAVLAVVLGLALLIWSADRFVEGAAATAVHMGMPALLIGMVVVGFGTSAPEMIVSALAASQGNPGIAIGNAYGSNIANIALILGTATLINPMIVHMQVLRKELPVLAGVTVLAAWQLWDGQITRLEAVVLLLVFAALMGWSIWQGLKEKNHAHAAETEPAQVVAGMSLKWAMIWLVIGLVFLLVSSRMLVWGAVAIAQGLGVSDLIIGLTVVALGTSLPELASSVVAARKGEHDIALGNVLGSNLFNTLAVVGIAGAIHPLKVAPEVLSRDVVVMAALTVALFIFGYNYQGRPGRLNRPVGVAFLTSYVAYNGYLIHKILS